VQSSVAASATRPVHRPHQQRALFARFARSRINTGPNRNPRKNLFPEEQVTSERKNFSGLDANCENQVGNGSGGCFSRLWIFAIIFRHSLISSVDAWKRAG
jgi:hypothetical protein